MPILKPISGHTSCAGVYRYLTKNGRALFAIFRSNRNIFVGKECGGFR